MGKYYINQKFSFRDRFTIKDENLTDVFVAEGELFSFGKRITIRMMSGEDLLLIKEKVFTLLSRFEFIVGDKLIGEMKRNFTFFKRSYEITNPNLQIKGDIWDHNYEITENNRTIAIISKKWFSMMDAYEIDIREEDYLELILGIVIAIDVDLLRDSQSSQSN